MKKIKNKKAYFKYDFLDKEIAGIVLSGTEIKSVVSGQVTFTDAYCSFKDGELWLKSLHISEYEKGSSHNHEPKRDRKLLLTKRQLRIFEEKINEKGLTIVPILIFTNNKGLVKVEIALSRGKRIYDKKQTIKERDIKRDMDREIKNYK